MHADCYILAVKSSLPMFFFKSKRADFSTIKSVCLEAGTHEKKKKKDLHRFIVYDSHLVQMYLRIKVGCEVCAVSPFMLGCAFSHQSYFLPETSSSRSFTYCLCAFPAILAAILASPGKSGPNPNGMKWNPSCTTFINLFCFVEANRVKAMSWHTDAVQSSKQVRAGVIDKNVL